MENIILGLLLLQSRTIYQLRKRINDGLNLMYSCSTGSIQAAIKKLLQNEYVTISEIREKGKIKKIYSITASGKDYFNNWANSSIDFSTVKNPELAKIYFMGLSSKENRTNMIAKHISNLQTTYLELEKICNDGEHLLTQMQKNEVFYFQLQTAKYGRDLLKFNINWFNKLLKSIKE